MTDIQGLFSIRKRHFLVKVGRFEVPYPDSEQVFSYLKHLIDERKEGLWRDGTSAERKLEIYSP